MRPIVILPFLILAACASPRQACLSDVDRSTRTIDQLVTITRANINRGFALETRQDLIERNQICETEQPDGSVLRQRCDTVDVIDREVAVAIDLNAEQAKLDSLVERQMILREQSAGARAQCIAIHPE